MVQAEDVDSASAELLALMHSKIQQAEPDDPRFGICFADIEISVSSPLRPSATASRDYQCIVVSAPDWLAFICPSFKHCVSSGATREDVVGKISQDMRAQASKWLEAHGTIPDASSVLPQFLFHQARATTSESERQLGGKMARFAHWPTKSKLRYCYDEQGQLCVRWPDGTTEPHP